MSRLTRRRGAPGWVALGWLALFFGAWSGAATLASADDGGVVVVADDPALVARIERAALQIEKVRGLAPLGPIRAEVQTRAEMRAQLEAMIAREISPAELAASERLLKALGILGRDVDYLAMMMDLYEDQVAGYYDARAGTLYLLSDDGLADDELILIHELFHAVQDQHFGLLALQEGVLRLSDASLARSALVEGDAMVVMATVPLGAPLGRAQAMLMMGAMEAFTGAMTPPALAPGLADVPPVIWRQLVFPYASGMGFVLQQFTEGGWPLVDSVYARPPVTTREILVPRLWRSGWQPTWLHTPALEGAALAEPARWIDAFCGEAAPPSVSDVHGPGSPGIAEVLEVERVVSDVVGVLTASAMLQQLLDGRVAPARLERASLSLAGDRMDVWGFPAQAERDLVLWLTVWDHEGAAREAAELLGLLGTAWTEGSWEGQAQGAHGAMAVTGDATGVVAVEQWGDLVLVGLDRGGPEAAQPRCRTLLAAMEQVMQEHQRTQFPSLAEP